MEMPAGIAATLDRVAAIVGPRTPKARGALQEDGCSEAYRALRSPDLVGKAARDITRLVELHPSHPGKRCPSLSDMHA